LILEAQKHRDLKVVIHGLYEPVGIRDVSCFAYNAIGILWLYGCHGHP
jgi:hypothetical protein